MLGFSERVLWIFGLPGSGKTTVAHALRDQLQSEGWSALVLDEEVLNSGSAPETGASEAGQRFEVKRAAEMAKTLSDQGAIVIVAMTTRMEQHRLLAREIIGDSLFLIQLNCTRALRDERTQSRGPLPEDGSFDPSELGAHVISTDKISGMQTAQLILKLLRLRQEHPAHVAASMVDKPVLRRILPRDQTTPGILRPGGATVQSLEEQSGHVSAEKSTGAFSERMPSAGAGMRFSQGSAGSQFRDPANQPEQGQPQPYVPPREAPSKSWRGTVETSVAKDSETGGTGDSSSEQGAKRSGRRRPRRFVENQELVWSPLSLIILTICAGIGVAFFVWVIDGSLKKKNEKERLFEGSVPAADTKPKQTEIPPPSDALTKKRNEGGR